MRNENASSVWLTEADCDIGQFKEHVARETSLGDYPHAAEIVSKIPVYDGASLRPLFGSGDTARTVTAEFNRAFSSGPGIIAIRQGYDDMALIDAVSDVLIEIIAQEEALSAGKGDHFAAAGSNSRLWNAHEKLCMREPELYARYNMNECVRRASEAWLGPGYQITTQVNVVRPGGKAQTPHRDYHMGFQAEESLELYPAPQHALSACLTLQGAIAHCDMPVESGPTKLLPYSQSYLPGYMAVLRQDFRDYFEEAYVQLALEKGDLMFFNPATFHAAGDNLTENIQRLANLMQVGSIYGRSTELVDRSRMTKTIYPFLQRLAGSGNCTEREIDNIVAATAEAYPFPANLDLDSPLSGMAPPSQQDVLRQALEESWSAEKLNMAVDEQDGRKRTH